MEKRKKIIPKLAKNVKAASENKKSASKTYRRKEKKSKLPFGRYIILTAAFALILAGFTLRIYLLTEETPMLPGEVAYKQTGAQTVAIPAMRGEIYDRNGKLLVSNSYTYRLECNVEMLLSYDGEADKLFELLKNAGDASEYPDAYSDVNEFYDFLSARTGSIILADDISLDTMATVLNGEIRGVSINKKAERTYLYDGYATQLLGHVGRIGEGNAEYYSELGYPTDALVGVDGIEAAYESYLHGTDGEMTVVYDIYGNVTDMTVTKEAVSGKNVFLTIDINAQIAAEDALEKRINELDGAEAGAVCALDINSGSILVSASYPTYNYNDYKYSYSELSVNELSPMFNRALNGLYAPGSVFKLSVAIAALEEGVITPDTEIEDLGVYEYYEGYQPKCWILEREGTTHGILNVRGAIANSCNYFFFETGRLTGIDIMNKWAKNLGLGEKTGCVLAESEPTLAGAGNRAGNGGYWSEGETLAAAIGQSENLFTPLQLCSYIGAIASGGVRNRANLLYAVTDSDGGNAEYFEQGEVISSVEISEGTLETVRGGMYDAGKSGAVGCAFADAAYEIAAKTGTAQMDDGGISNALIGIYAPFDNPQVAALCVIEHGENGYSAAAPIRMMLDELVRAKNE